MKMTDPRPTNSKKGPVPMVAIIMECRMLVLTEITVIIYRTSLEAIFLSGEEEVVHCLPGCLMVVYLDLEEGLN